MKIVIIDNYDSFTYNLSHLIKSLGAEVDVVRNDQFRDRAFPLKQVFCSMSSAPMPERSPSSVSA